MPCIDKLTYGEIKELVQVFGQTQSVQPAANNFFEVGKSYLIRTVTFIQVGKVKAVSNQEILLENASWIADTGRFYDALTKGVEVLSEIEPFPSDVIVGRGAIVDATLWTHDLPKKQK